MAVDGWAIIFGTTKKLPNINRSTIEITLHRICNQKAQTPAITKILIKAMRASNPDFRINPRSRRGLGGAATRLGPSLLYQM